MICKEEDCKIQALFNFKNIKPPIYCSIHKEINMVNVTEKRKCKEDNCNKQPQFNIKNEKKGIYCSTHKKENMINITEKRKCKEENCNKQPQFNIENEKKGIYCSTHKKENMVNVAEKRKCKEENCNKDSSYGYLNETTNLLVNKFEYCAEHKKENMINIKTKRCKEIGCDILGPKFNLANENIGLYCSKHKKEDMINVKDKMCLECKITYSNPNSKYKGFCVRCFINLFPNEKISRNYKVKENHMTDFIKSEYKNEVMVFDKQTGGCSKRRPDCYIDKFTHIVIIECDENQHRDTSCENKHMMELFQDFGNRPIVFIRFNPDKYITKNQKIPSSFKMHKSLDVPVVRDKIEWNNRLQLLKTFINKWLNEIPIKEVTNEYLFYDER
jgi:hypothetical protein